MKTIISIFCFLCFSCGEKQNVQTNKTIVSFIADVTDSVSVLPQANPLLHIYGLDKEPETEAVFRFKTIQDVALVPIQMHRLPAPAEIDDGKDPQFRKRTILNFYTAVRTTIDNFQRDIKNNSQLPHSECYVTVRDELVYLANECAYKKVLIVSSNLFENSEMNVYKNEKLSSKQIAEVFDKTNPLPKRLDGISIYFVFKPKDRVEDKRYEVVVAVYKKLLEQRGASVRIQATADNFN